ncbi:MAG TPA: LCP family protein [Ktedonobacteraceae bacterium]|jgi:LCP family protein required for cell wall assembly|nr:LCP family protein [Ktedonobacteraceae bacterium]
MDEPTRPLRPERRIPGNTGSQPPTRRVRGPRSRRLRILLYILLVLTLAMCGLFAYAYAYFQNNVNQPVQQFIHAVSRSNDEPPVDEAAITDRPWNILLLGSDNDSKYNFPALLTQVMMVVHVDPTSNSAYLVSIPRDSWVYVPEIGGMHKIDQAFLLGAAPHSSFDDGVRLARLTVEKDYGITIDRYAWVGLDGFASVIDTLGGVDVDVTHPILDDNYPDDTSGKGDPYGLKRLYIVPGPQHMNGQQALAYVRSRHADLVGDIGRTERQQEVLTALKKKLDASNVLSHLTQILADLKGKLYTDLSEQEMISIANFGRSLSNSAIKRITLGPGTGSQDFGNYATVYDPSAGGNQDVIIPHCSTIQPVINTIFGLGNAQSCDVNGP